jgi:hypothetical protein
MEFIPIHLNCSAVGPFWQILLWFARCLLSCTFHQKCRYETRIYNTVSNDSIFMHLGKKISGSLRHVHKHQQDTEYESGSAFNPRFFIMVSISNASASCALPVAFASSIFSADSESRKLL